jgi:anti-sigma factor RsiW
MSDKPPLNEQDRADLVAYLDGELDGDAARALEARLSKDGAVRTEADLLKQTYDLLDLLPRPEPSPTFTTRTLERLTPVKGTRPGQAGSGPRWRAWLLGVGWAAALVLAFLTGMGIVRYALGRHEPDDRDLARELRLIENRGVYELGDNIEFLKQLSQPDLFGDDSSGS